MINNGHAPLRSVPPTPNGKSKEVEVLKRRAWGMGIAALIACIVAYLAVCDARTAKEGRDDYKSLYERAEYDLYLTKHPEAVTPEDQEERQETDLLRDINEREVYLSRQSPTATKKENDLQGATDLLRDIVLKPAK
jgi:hypothetical protein